MNVRTIAGTHHPVAAWFHRTDSGFGVGVTIAARRHYALHVIAAGAVHVEDGSDPTAVIVAASREDDSGNSALYPLGGVSVGELRTVLAAAITRELAEAEGQLRPDGHGGEVVEPRPLTFVERALCDASILIETRITEAVVGAEQDALRRHVAEERP